MSPCGRSTNANHWLGCCSVFTCRFYPNFFIDYYFSLVTAKVTFLPVFRGNLRPTFLLDYWGHVKKYSSFGWCAAAYNGSRKSSCWQKRRWDRALEDDTRTLVPLMGLQICFRSVSHLLRSIGPFSKHLHDLKAQAGWHLKEEKKSHVKYHYQKVKSYRQWDVKGPQICTCLLVPLLVIPQWQVEGELAEPFRWGLRNVEMHSVYFCNCNKGNEVIT